MTKDKTTERSDLVAKAHFNARLAVVLNFFGDSTFILPIWLLYSLNVLHLVPTLAVGIFMCIWVVSALLEVPTGAWADRLGRKKMFIIGQFLFALYPLAYAFEIAVPLLIATCLVSAVGSALRSGALLPIVHRSYKKAELSDKEYESFLSTYMVATFVARAIASLAGAALYAVNPKYPFYAMSLVTIANFFLGFAIRDGNKMADEAHESTNWGHIKHTARAMMASDIVMGILVAFIAFDLAAETVWTGYQVFFKADGRSAVVIGALFSIISICSAIGAYAVRYASTRVHPMRIMQVFGLAIFTTTLLIFQPIHWLRLLGVIPMGFVSGISLFVLNGTIQKNIKNAYQSTALSVVSLSMYGVYGAGSLVFGLLLQLFGEQRTRLIIFLVSFGALGMVTLYLRQKKQIWNYSFRSKTALEYQNDADI